MVLKTRTKKRAQTKTRHQPIEMVKVGKKQLPRYAYEDTPFGTWREDRKTGKRVWRKLGNPFPEK